MKTFILFWYVPITILTNYPWLHESKTGKHILFGPPKKKEKKKHPLHYACNCVNLCQHQYISLIYTNWSGSISWQGLTKKVATLHECHVIATQILWSSVACTCSIIIKLWLSGVVVVEEVDVGHSMKWRSRRSIIKIWLPLLNRSWFHIERNIWRCMIYMATTRLHATTMCPKIQDEHWVRLHQ